MRFKASLTWEQIDLFHNLVTSISRLNVGEKSSSSEKNTSMTLIGNNKAVIMYIDPDHIRICARGGFGHSNPGLTLSGSYSTSGIEDICCFVELATEGGIFLEHHVESMSDNIIVFEISLEQLRLVLRSILTSGTSARSYATRGRDNICLLNQISKDERTTTVKTSELLTSPSIVVIKLAKRNRGIPCLCLDACMYGQGSMEVYHAIPIYLMKASEMQYYFPPETNKPNIQLELPPNRPLRCIIERLRSISPYIYLEGSMNGELILKVDEQLASIRVFLNQLRPVFEGSQVSESQLRCKLKVDSNKLLASFLWQGPLSIGKSVSSSTICMIENEMLVLHIVLNPTTVGFFTYYIPVHFLHEEL